MMLNVVSKDKLISNKEIRESAQWCTSARSVTLTGRPLDTTHLKL